MFHFKKHIFIFFLFSIILLPSCDEPEDDPFKKLTFEQKASLPVSGISSAVGFSINGKGYVLLGRTGFDTGYLNDMWEYNPATDEWTKKKPYPGKARVKAVAVVVGNKAYVGLGFLGKAFSRGDYITDFYSYDPITDEWEKLAGFPGGDTSAPFSFVMNNRIYVGSGFEYLTIVNYFWCFYPDDNRWVRLNDLPGDNRFGAVGCSDGEKAYFGTGFKGVNENDWWEYNVIKDTWTAKRSMPDRGRVNGVATTVNNRFFVMTGRIFNGIHNGGKVLADVNEYDPVRNRWHNRGQIPGGGRENAVSFVINNRVYIGLGENDTTRMSDFWSFEP